MDMINLDEATVSYEGQKIPVKILIKKLQDQLRESANRLNSIAFVLDELYTSIEKSRFVELRLTLTQGEYEKFQTLTGDSDREKLKKALQLLPRVETTEPAAEFPESQNPSQPSREPHISEKILYATEKTAGPLAHADETDMDSSPLSGIKRNLIRCPRCKNPMDIPEVSMEQWPIEVKCNHCGAKCLIKSRSGGNPTRKNALESMDDPPPYGKMFDMLAT